MCTQIVVESCLTEVERIWRQNPEEKRPWGVWRFHKCHDQMALLMQIDSEDNLDYLLGVHI
jgi:hypothetical protein